MIGQPPVVASLSVSRTTQEMQVVMRVQSQPPQPLTWRLVAETLGPGGESRTSQRGRTDGEDRAPLARLSFGPSVKGRLSLTVTGQNGVVVQRTCRLGDAAQEGPPQC
jgi:hypothetical protein